MKFLLLLLFLLPIIVHSQIRPNRNIDARELSYLLKNDTLIIKSEHRISNVTIRNNEFRKTYTTNHPKEIIDISDYPKGYYVVIVITNKKVITFNFTK